MSRELYYSLDNIFILHGAFKALERLLGWIMDITMQSLIQHIFIPIIDFHFYFV